jgi:hypothetical protein
LQKKAKTDASQRKATDDRGVESYLAGTGKKSSSTAEDTSEKKAKKKKKLAEG